MALLQLMSISTHGSLALAFLTASKRNTLYRQKTRLK
jgi:hypothetical protein